MILKKLLVCMTVLTFGYVLFGHSTFAATHTIKTDETLEEISDKYDITIDALLKLNELQTVDQAITGFVLKLPSTVKNKVAIKEKKKDELDDYEVTKTFKVSASAYTPYCKGCSGYSRTGINLRKDPSIKVISVDPKVIPLGSKVWVEGYGIAVAGDTGGSIKGKKIDILVASKKAAYSWGRRTVTVKLLK